MSDEKTRFVRSLRGLADTHEDMAEVLRESATKIEEGDLEMADILEHLKEENQQLYLELAV